MASAATPPTPKTNYWWDVCQHGTSCLPWNPGNPKDQPDWGVTGERSDYGVPLPQGTPVQSPVSGIVLGQHPGGGWYSVFGQQSFGGEVDVLSNVPEYGGLVNVGVIHMDTASVVPGQVVQKGTILGTSGGQTSGGHWPSSPKYSSGPHVGLQVHNIYQWGDLKNPGVLMQNLWANKDTSSVPTENQLTSAKLTAVTQGGPQGGCDWTTWLRCLTQPDAVACAACSANATAAVAASGACAPWDVACLLRQGAPFVLRAVKFVAGFGILLLATLITFLPEVGAGVAIASGVPEAAPAVSQALGGRRRLPQSQPGAAVQAISIFRAHGQKQKREERANVAAQQRGQNAPFPAARGAPGQPAARAAGAAGPPTQPPRVPFAGPPPRHPVRRLNRGTTPLTAPLKRQPPPGSPVQRGPQTGLHWPQGLAHPTILGARTPSGTGRFSPNTINPAPPPPQPGTGRDDANKTGRWPTPPTPKQPRAPKEPPMPVPTTPPLASPVPAPPAPPAPPGRRGPVPPRVIAGAPSRVGAGRGRRKGQTAAPRPVKGGLTFEQALERVRQQVRIAPTPRLPSGIETARPEETGVNLRDLSKAWKQAPREGQTWSDFLREK